MGKNYYKDPFLEHPNEKKLGTKWKYKKKTTKYCKSEIRCKLDRLSRDLRNNECWRLQSSSSNNDHEDEYDYDDDGDDDDDDYYDAIGVGHLRHGLTLSCGE